LFGFSVVAGVASVRWRRHRDPAGGWGAATFCLIAVMTLVTSIHQPNGHEPGLFNKALVLATMLVPYFLYRFMTSFEQAPPWQHAIAHGGLALTVVSTLIVKDVPSADRPHGKLAAAYVGLCLLYWVVVIGFVVARLWAASRRLPTVARRRAELLAIAPLVLTFALIGAASTPTQAPGPYIKVIDLVSAGLFLVGFAPPAWLVGRWRRTDEVAFRAALVDTANTTHDPNHVIEAMLPRLCRVLGATRVELLGKDGTPLGDVGDHRTSQQPIRVQVGERFLVVWPNSYTPFFGQEVRDVARSLGSLLHLTVERTTAQTNEARARLDLLEAQRIAHLGSWTWEVETGRLDWSDEMFRIHGFVPQPRSPHFDVYRTLIHPKDQTQTEQLFQRAVAELTPFDTEYRVVRADGTVRWLHALGQVTAGSDGRAREIFGTCQDITDRRELQLRLTRQALHDELTGLPNRAMLIGRLRSAVSDLGGRGVSAAILFIDVDRFKIINDSLGHDAGDDVLITLAERISAILRPTDTVARFGSDEFVVMCTHVQDRREALEIAGRVREAAREPILWRDAELVVSLSIGIALSTVTGQDPAELIRDADAAMYRAKQDGRDRAVLFADNMRAAAVRRLETETDLRRALSSDQLKVFYQPIVRLADRSLVGFEALVRWQHPTRGLLAPGDFLGVAEETGLIVPIGEWVLEQACVQLNEWHADYAHRSQLWVSVNLSARQVSQPDFADQAAEILRRTAVDPGLVELEITESLLMLDTRESSRILSALGDLGLRLCVDDFGTGYSSLSYLKRFPVQKLKVDRSFVAGLGADADDSAIVQAILALAGSLGLESVAEGIETTAQLDVLKALGCPDGQGTLFSPARPAGSFVAWLSQVDEKAAAV